MALRIGENSVNGIQDITAYIADTKADMADLPSDASMGSYVEVLDDDGEFNVYMVNSEGTWIKL